MLKEGEGREMGGWREKMIKWEVRGVGGMMEKKKKRGI